MSEYCVCECSSAIFTKNDEIFCGQCQKPIKIPPKKTVDRVVEAVRADLLQRSQVGIAKYGVSLERTDLSLRDWLQHAYEETLDQANYLKRAIITIDEAKRK